MRIPTPEDLVGLASKGAEGIGDAMNAVPRLLGLLEQAEQLIKRTDNVIGEVEQTVQRADALVGRTGGVVDRAESMISTLEPHLVTLAPVLERLAETTDPDEVEALVKVVDQLPELVPIVKTLGTVGDDVHDLLLMSAQLSEMLTHLPGMGRVRRKVEEESAEEERIRELRERRESDTE